MDFDVNSRRRHQRRSMQVVFHIDKLKDATDKPLPITAPHFLLVDLSASGARFETNHAIPERALVSGHFELPGDVTPIHCELIILRTNSPRSLTGMSYTLAAEFITISDADRRRIEQHVTAGGFVI